MAYSHHQYGFPLDPVSLAHFHRMNNTDPTNEFMYQMGPDPGPGPHTYRPQQTGDSPLGSDSSEGDKELKTPERQSLDLTALNERLRTLGLPDQPAPSPSCTSPHRTQFTCAPTNNPTGLRSAFLSPTSAARQKQPSVVDLRPQDSISMYRPSRPPKGGTNVDGQEDIYSPETDGAGTLYGYDETDDGVTRGSPKTGMSLDQPTLGPTSNWTRGSLAGDMYTMRERLLAAQRDRDLAAQQTIQQQIDETSRLAAALTRLEAAEKQLRDTQASLIAERLARTQIQERSRVDEDGMRDCRNELAGAVRALRRAREEGRRADEERRRLQRAFEETKTQLYKYHEEIKVRDARQQGKEEGRQEAWQEAERWMGGDPPIPVDPIQSVPPAVLRQTPLLPNQQQLHEPQSQPFQAQWIGGPAAVPPGTSPAVQGPGPAFPHQQQQQQQQQQLYASHQPSTSPAPPQQPFQPMTMPPADTHAPMPSQFSNLDLAPQNQYEGLSQMSQGMPQHVSQPALGRPSQTAQMLSPSQEQTQLHRQYSQTASRHHTPAPSQHTLHPPTSQYTLPPQPMGMINIQQPLPSQYAQQPMIVPMPMATVPPPQSTQPIYPTQPPMTHSVPPRTAALPSQHGYAKAATVASQTPRRTPSAAPHRTTTTTSVRRVPQSAGVQPPVFDSAPRPTAADSYLDRVEHDHHFRQILSGAPSRTVHTADFPASESAHVQQQHSQPPRSEKPLPNPFTSQQSHQTPRSHVTSQLSRAHTTKPPSSVRTAVGKRSASHAHARRASLMDGLHNYAGTESLIPDGDRYPAFPGAGRGGREGGSSFGSVDPAGFALPMSASESYMHTPEQTHRTPGTKSGRSRMASALRTDTEFDLPPQLSQIEEAAEEEGGPRRSLLESRVMQNMPPPEQDRTASQRSQAQSHGSRPPMPTRWQPKPVMPSRLAGGKVPSEPHGHPHGPRASMPRRAGTVVDRYPSPPSNDQPINTHNLYVPPGLAPQAVGAGVEDVQGPLRHSALGLQNMGGGDGQQHRAPTITIQPPVRRRWFGKGQ